MVLLQASCWKLLIEKSNFIPRLGDGLHFRTFLLQFDVSLTRLVSTEAKSVIINSSAFIVLNTCLFEKYERMLSVTSKWCSLLKPFCVAVARQAHRDHVVRPRRRRRHRRRHRRCRRHTFRFRSITFEGMYGFHLNFAELYTIYHYKIQVKFDIGNHPPNFG